jgi:hypothetical protein
MTGSPSHGASRAARAAVLAVVLVAASCRVPERLAGMAADRLLAMWQSVSANESTVETTPDALRAAARKVRTRNVTVDLQKPTYRYRTTALAPAEAAGSATGGRWGGAWVLDAAARTLVEVRGMRAWNAEANRRILVHIVGRSFANFDFSSASGSCAGRETEIVTATPLAAAPYRTRTVSETDAATGYVHRMRFFDESVRVVSSWDTLEYRTNGSYTDDLFEAPAADAKTVLRWTVGGENLGAERGRLGFAPVLIAGRKGVHRVQDGGGGVAGLVSDYTDADGSFYVVQWPAGRGRARVPFARTVQVGGREVAVTLIGPYAAVLWSDGRRELVALGEIDAATMFALLETLKE